MSASEEMEWKILGKLQAKYDDFKFYRHDSYRDFVQMKGFIFRRPTGVIIEAKDIVWERDNYSAKYRSNGHVYDIKKTVYYYLDFEHKICLYKFS